MILGKETSAGEVRGIRWVFPVLFALVLVASASICLVFFVFNSPSAVNRLSDLLEPVTGYRVRVDHISLSTALAGEIDNLRVTEQGKGTPLASFSRVEFEAGLRPRTEVAIQKIVLHHPKFMFTLKPRKKETDWSGLDKLPPVRLLEIKEGEMEISGEAYSIKATHLNVTIDNFSPRKGGKARVVSEFTMDATVGEAREVEKITGDGTVSADIRFASLFPNITGKGDLTVTLRSGTFKGLSLKETVLNTPVFLDSKKFSFDKATLRMGSLGYGASADQGILRGVALNGSGSFDRRSSMLSVDSVSGNFPDAGEFAGNGAAKFADDLPWKASFSANSVNFTRIFALINPWLSEDYRKWGVRGKGNLVGELESRWTNNSGLSGVVSLEISDGGFTSDDKSTAAAGLTGKILLRLSPQKTTKKGFSGRFEMKGGEFLRGGFYKDFGGERLSVSSEGQLSFDPGFFLDCTGDVDFYQTGNYKYRVSLKDGSLLFHATAANVSNSRVHALLLKDYLGQDSTFSEVELSGTSDFTLSVAQNAGGETAMAGRVRTAGTSVTLPKPKITLENLRIDLPFDLLFNSPTGKDKGSPETGFIEFKRFQRADIAVEHLQIPVTAGRNRFETTRAIDMELFGGKVRIGAVKINNATTPSLHVSTGIVADHLDLSKLTQELLGVVLPGSVNADLGEVTLTQGKWASPGKINVSVFGGAVEVKNLSASHLLAPSRTVAGDVGFTGLDLEQMTNLTKTGRVTGFVKGSITDLSMVYGEPSTFILKLESETDRPSSRMISVDAIENLSIIGTGSSGISAVLNSGLNRFFKAYPYSRIGIMCTLKNDTFRLRGTIHEGTTEYLIRKGLFRGIDVVNQNPDNSISFRDMQERIGRIFKSDKARVS